MPPSSSILLLILISFAILSMAASYLLTAFRKKQMHCPECGEKTPATAAYYIDEATGERMPAEVDVTFGLISSAARMLIGVIAIISVFIRLISALGYDNCDLQGISMLCSQAGQVDLTVNLLYSLVVIAGGVYIGVTGTNQFLRARSSMGKSTTYVYVCHNDHHWEEG
jgi:hypothetical protein